MGQHQARLVELEAGEHQQVDVDRAGRVTAVRRLAAELALNLLAGGQQLLRGECRLDGDRCVVEVVLADRVVHRLRLVDRGASGHLQPFQGAQSHERLAEVREPVAEIGAESEVAPAQRFTSTETSSTGSGMGGSDLVARTTIPVALKRSSSMSATAVQRRSSVR